MRISNEMYPRGSVIIPRLPIGSDRMFLNGRPMIVVSQLPPFNSLTCIECTSRDRPGIEISLYQHRLGKYNADMQYSVACPYAIHDIPVKMICDYLGVINPITMRAIANAMAWHLGLTDVVPPYMTQLLEEEFAPVYNMGTQDNTALSIVHGSCSMIETNRKFAEVATTECPGAPYAKNTTSTLVDAPVKMSEETQQIIDYDPAQAVIDWVKSAVSPNPSAITLVKDFHAAYVQATHDDMKIIGFSQRLGRAIKTLIPGAKRIKITKGPDVGKSGFAGVGLTQEASEDIQLVSTNSTAYRSKIYSGFSTEDRFGILIHRIRPGDTYDGTKLTAEDISWLTRRILDDHGYCNSTFTEDLVKGIENQHYHWSFIDQDKVIALMLYGDWDKIKPSAFMKLQTRFKHLITTEHLDFSDLRKWPRIVNGKDLKALSSGGGGKLDPPLPVRVYSDLLQSMGV